MFTQQFNLLGWLTNFELFLNAAIIYYGLGAAAMQETQLTYNEFLEWLRVVQPAGIRDAVALGCLTYSHTRWGTVGVKQRWMLAAMERLEYHPAHVISLRVPVADSDGISIHKSIGVITPHRRQSQRLRTRQSSPDVAAPEIRVEFNTAALCDDCRFYSDILRKSFFECLTTEACCPNVEVCRSCLAREQKGHIP